MSGKDGAKPEQPENSNWTPISMSVESDAAGMPESSAADGREVAGLMAEQIRMRADMERLLRENEELRGGQVRVLRLVSEGAAGRDGHDIRDAVLSVLNKWSREDGDAPAAVVGPVPSLEDLRAALGELGLLAGEPRARAQAAVSLQ